MNFIAKSFEELAKEIHKICEGLGLESDLYSPLELGGGGHKAAAGLLRVVGGECFLGYSVPWCRKNLYRCNGSPRVYENRRSLFGCEAVRLYGQPLKHSLSFDKI